MQPVITKQVIKSLLPKTKKFLKHIYKKCNKKKIDVKSIV